MGKQMKWLASVDSFSQWKWLKGWWRKEGNGEEGWEVDKINGQELSMHSNVYYLFATNFFVAII